MTNGIIKFKTVRVSKEWESGKLPQKLKDIIVLLAYYSITFFKIPITITCIFRTQEEQDKIYQGNVTYHHKPWKSNHQYWNAIDLRSKDFTEKQIEILVSIANTIRYRTKGKTTAVYHKVNGGAFHFHIQC